MPDKPISIYEQIALLAPGTTLREGLENILIAKVGATILVGDLKDVEGVIRAMAGFEDSEE